MDEEPPQYDDRDEFTKAHHENLARMTQAPSKDEIKFHKLLEKKSIVIRTASFIIGNRDVSGAEAVRLAVEVYNASQKLFAEDEAILELLKRFEK